MEETLLEYLRRPNPEILHAARKRSKTLTKNVVYTHPRWIKKWEGLEWDTLKRMYDDALRRSKERAHLAELSPQDRTLNNEDGFGDVVLQWNKKIISQALVDFQEHMGHDQIIVMVRGSHAERCPGPTKAFRPDWAAIVRPSAQEAFNPLVLKPSIMPGDSKYSKNWTSSKIEDGQCLYNSPDEYPTWLWPLAQIYTYCYRIETRYGYLITDEELVVVRIGPKKDEPSSPGPRDPKRLAIEELATDGLLEWASIPWCNGRTADGREVKEGNGMSINTALWWMHIQALYDHSIQWKYEPLEKDVFRSTRRDSAREITQANHFHSASTQGDDVLFPSFRAGPCHDDEPSVPEPGRAAGPKRRGRPRKRATSRDGEISENTTPTASFVSQISAISGNTDISQGRGRGKRKLVLDVPAAEKENGGGKRKKH